MKIGTRGWIGLATYVILFDWWAIRKRKETLSCAFARSTAHPIRRPFVTIIWVYLSLHLFDRLPKKLDLWKRFFPSE